MSARTMTPIREEDIEGTMAADDGTPTPTLEGGTGVNANVTVKTTIPRSEKEEIKTSSSTSTIVPVRKETEKNVDSGMITVGHFSQVPSVKWHPELEMMSKAGLTQGQYERKVVAQGYVCSAFICYSAMISFSCNNTIPLRVDPVMHKRLALPLFSLCGSFSRCIVCAHSDVVYSFTTHHRHSSGQSKGLGWREGRAIGSLSRD